MEEIYKNTCQNCQHDCHCEDIVCVEPVEGFAENQPCACGSCTCNMKTDWD